MYMIREPKWCTCESPADFFKKSNGTFITVRKTMCCSDNKWHSIKDRLPDEDRLVIASGKEELMYSAGTRRFYYIGTVKVEENGFRMFWLKDCVSTSEDDKEFGLFIDLKENGFRDMLRFSRLFDKWKYLEL